MPKNPNPTSAEQLGSEPQAASMSNGAALQPADVQAFRKLAQTEATATITKIKDLVQAERLRLHIFDEPLRTERHITSTISLLIHTFGQLEGQLAEVWRV